MREIRIHTDYNRKGVGALQSNDPQGETALRKQSASQFEQLSIGRVFDDIDKARRRGFTCDEELYEDGLLLTYRSSKVEMTYEVRLGHTGNLKMLLKKSERLDNANK